MPVWLLTLLKGLASELLMGLVAEIMAVLKARPDNSLNKDADKISEIIAANETHGEPAHVEEKVPLAHKHRKHSDATPETIKHETGVEQRSPEHVEQLTPEHVG